jgi:hypothetical protein
VTDEPFVLSFRVVASIVVLLPDGTLGIKLPFSDCLTDVEDTAGLRLEKPKDWYLASPTEWGYNARIEFQPNIKLALPITVDFQNEYIAYTSRYEVAGTVLTAKRNLKINKAEEAFSRSKQYKDFPEELLKDSAAILRFAQ